LGKKPDTLTRRWDVYENNSSEKTLDQRPFFTQNQLLSCPISIGDQPLALRAAMMIDPQSLLSNIKEAQKSKPLAVERTKEDPCWIKGEDNLWYYKGLIYVPKNDDLHLQVLKSRHNHVLAGHPGQLKTYQLICRDFNWPNLQEFVVDYIQFCNVCERNKFWHHKPYGLLKQLLIPPCPWESISMDFIEQLPSSEGYTITNSHLLFVMGALIL